MDKQTLLQKTKKILEEKNLIPNKRFGQNFLINKNEITSLVNSASISKKDTVVEVGPGTGNVTAELLKKAGEVISIDKDPNMIEILNERFSKEANISILKKDILAFKPENKKYKLFGAPPYYLTGRLFRHFLENSEHTPTLIAVVIQKEVAEKIIATPPKMNLLAVSVQLYGKAYLVKKVPRNCFWPQPDVDSALLVIKNIKKPAVNEKELFTLIRAGFSSPRKQLVVNLSKILKIPKEDVGEWLKKIDIDPKRRAETLTTEDWLNLYKLYSG